jgi:hypothetical protein
MKPNGPAIWGGCVTRPVLTEASGRKHPGTRQLAGWYFSSARWRITVQDLYCGQVRVSRYKNHYKFVLSAGAEAKSMTSNLPILSVLYAVLFFF